MNDIAYQRAEALIETRLEFYRHAIVYFALNLLVTILNLTQTPEDLWFQRPLLGWGIGLLAHGLKGLLLPPRWGPQRADGSKPNGTRSAPAPGTPSGLSA